MTDPEEEQVFLSPEDLKRLLDDLGLAEPEARRQVAGALKGVEPRGPVMARLEQEAQRAEEPATLEAAMTLLRHLGRPGATKVAGSNPVARST